MYYLNFSIISFLNPEKYNARQCVVALLCLLFTNTLPAQNLILNGDFEEYSQLPTNISQLKHCKDVLNPSSPTPDENLWESTTPDFFHGFSFLPQQLPYFNHISAQSKYGFVGLSCLSALDDGKATDYREYIILKISEPLQSTLSYKFKMYIANGKFVYNRFSTIINLASNAFQIKFLNTAPVQFEQSPLIMTPDFSIDTVFYSEQWQEITFDYTAKGDEKFIILGNLLKPEDEQFYQLEDDTVTLKPFWRMNSYLFLDNASLELISDYPLSGDTINTICEGEQTTLKVAGDSLISWYQLPENNRIAVNDTSIIVKPSVNTWYRIIGRTDTLDVFVKVLKNPSIIYKDTLVCLDEEWLPSQNSNYYDSLWVDNERPNVPLFSPASLPITYWLNGCAINDTILYELEDCEVLLEFPNIITPNSDDKNECFKPIKHKGIMTAQLDIYNRWGKNIYTTHQLESGWQPENHSDGIYYWSCNYTDRNNHEGFLKGTILLTR